MLSRHRFLASLLAILAASLTVPSASAQKRQTQNIILVTADGLRWQDVFRGVDATIGKAEEAGMKEGAPVRERFSGATAEESRRKLMPFLWDQIAKQGVILGNRDKGNTVRVTNPHRVSYPGYSEILTGRVQEAIRGNDPIQNPTPTVLEFFRQKWNLRPEQVALFGSWDTFQQIGEHTPGSIFISAGATPLKGKKLSSRMRELDSMQFEIMPPWRSTRHDYITFEMALEYMKTEKPRVIYVPLDETDDWAHDHRYDRVLELANYFDKCLRRFWETVQAMPEYRGKTTLVVASDHGRGSTLKDWGGHGSDVDGAEFIWLAAIGPDTPATGEGGAGGEAEQRDIAPTILRLAGIDPAEYQGVTGKPIPALIKP